MFLRKRTGHCANQPLSMCGLIIGSFTQKSVLSNMGEDARRAHTAYSMLKGFMCLWCVWQYTGESLILRVPLFPALSIGPNLFANLHPHFCLLFLVVSAFSAYKCALISCGLKPLFISSAPWSFHSITVLSSIANISMKLLVFAARFWLGVFLPHPPSPKHCICLSWGFCQSYSCLTFLFRQRHILPSTFEFLGTHS